MVAEPPLAAQPLTERLLTGVLQFQDGPAAKLPQPLASQLDDGAAADFTQCPFFSAQPPRLLLVEGDLEDVLVDLGAAVLVVRDPLHEQGAGRGAGARTRRTVHSASSA